jgi:hypothetical protein
LEIGLLLFSEAYTRKNGNIFNRERKIDKEIMLLLCSGIGYPLGYFWHFELPRGFGGTRNLATNYNNRPIYTHFVAIKTKYI